MFSETSFKSVKDWLEKYKFYVSMGDSEVSDVNSQTKDILPVYLDADIQFVHAHARTHTCGTPSQNSAAYPRSLSADPRLTYDH